MEYLGQPIEGVDNYRVRFGDYETRRIYNWGEAKQLAEDYMAYDPYINVEVFTATEAYIETLYWR